MATIGDVITITATHLGSRPRPARKAIITRTEGLGEGTYGAWFYTQGKAEFDSFNGTTSTTGTVLAVRDTEFTVIGDVTTEFSTDMMRRLIRGLEGTEIARHHEATGLLELIKTEREWLIN